MQLSCLHFSINSYLFPIFSCFLFLFHNGFKVNNLFFSFFFFLFLSGIFILFLLFFNSLLFYLIFAKEWSLPLREGIIPTLWKREGKVLRVLLSVSCLPRNDRWLIFSETRLVTVRKSKIKGIIWDGDRR